VRDNGAGCPDEESLAASSGIGIRNTRSRLEKLYPGRHEFRLRTSPEGGCEARITIPLTLRVLRADGESVRVAPFVARG
jgi:signal transduction histidine kinase